MILALNMIRLLKTRLVPKFNNFTKVAFSPKYLFYTNVTISVTLSAAGDILEQHYEIHTGELESWDPKRTMKMAFTGMTVGIICHHWYRVLDRHLPGKSLQVVLKKVILDQVLCSPAYITIFFMTSALLEGSTFSEFLEEYKDKFWKLYVAEWVVWPTAQIVNFYFLPNRFRVLYDNTISLGYDVYTSHIKHQPERKKLENES